MNKQNKTELKPGEESVWDYPRPPRLEPFSKLIRIIFNEVEIVNSISAVRVLETSHPPVYYIPRADIKMQYMTPAENRTFCEWKGEASYYHLTIGDKTARYACWYYPKPVTAFAELKDHIAFYAQKMDACYIDDELVTPQPGKFYGGWITKGIIGPFKGEEGV